MDIETKLYVVADASKGYLEYLDFDGSVGYPYANTSVGYKTSNLRRAVDCLNDEAKSTHVGFKTPKVYEIVLREVDTTDLVDEEKVVDDLLDSLTEQQKKILRRKL